MASTRRVTCSKDFLKCILIKNHHAHVGLNKTKVLMSDRFILGIFRSSFLIKNVKNIRRFIFFVGEALEKVSLFSWR